MILDADWDAVRLGCEQIALDALLVLGDDSDGSCQDASGATIVLLKEDLSGRKISLHPIDAFALGGSEGVDALVGVTDNSQSSFLGKLLKNLVLDMVRILELVDEHTANVGQDPPMIREQLQALQKQIIKIESIGSFEGGLICWRKDVFRPQLGKERFSKMRNLQSK